MHSEMGMSDGYITLSRKFFQTAIWKTARTFNESEAWLDLIQSARFELSEHFARVGGRDVEVRRGEVVASQRFLARKWKWSDMKVRSFIAKLRREGMVTTETRSGTTIIRLVNYDKYNAANKAENAANNADNALSESELIERITQQITQLAEKQRKPNAKKNKENNIYPPPPPRACECVRDEIREMAANDQWAEVTCMKFRMKPAELTSKLEDFATDCECRGKTVHSCIADAQSHFISWMMRKEQLKHKDHGTDNHRTSAEYVADSVSRGIEEAELFVREAKRRRGEV